MSSRGRYLGYPGCVVQPTHGILPTPQRAGDTVRQPIHRYDQSQLGQSNPQPQRPADKALQPPSTTMRDESRSQRAPTRLTESKASTANCCTASNPTHGTHLPRLPGPSRKAC
ncbi:hypothetical protein FA95DRAFT_1557442 [Auriscalpium vulgare]|uniref:Uncharacterized protein n=1 Tax=Auriscalpium vulgare TaxID=40419 RepID=A0ACB8RY52_9AGAM|nr:hypothetical protein FA95DRAFT_1557442 [Auriscalpium vulgare]